MTSCSEKLPLRVRIRLLRGADRIVAAKAGRLEGAKDDPRNPPSRLNEPAESTLCVGRTRIDEDPVYPVLRVDSFSQGAGRITAFEGDLIDQQVRKGMHHVERHSVEIPDIIPFAEFLMEARFQDLGPCLCFGATHP